MKYLSKTSAMRDWSKAACSSISSADLCDSAQ